MKFAQERVGERMNVNEGGERKQKTPTDRDTTTRQKKEKRKPHTSMPGQESVVFRARVLYDFDGETEAELSLREGDIIDVHSTICGEGWWQGTCCEASGLFPEAYVERIDGGVSEPIYTEYDDEFYSNGTVLSCSSSFSIYISVYICPSLSLSLW